jgi:hypothetical protein
MRFARFHINVGVLWLIATSRMLSIVGSLIGNHASIIGLNHHATATRFRRNHAFGQNYNHPLMIR